MEVKIKNINLLPTAEQMSLLLKEKISFGTKNRIQKIIKEVMVHHNPFNTLWCELLKAHGGTEIDGKIELPDPKNPPEEFVKEFKELCEDEVTLNVDLIDYSKLESIESENVYSEELLKPFFENYI